MSLRDRIGRLGRGAPVPRAGSAVPCQGSGSAELEELRERIALSLHAGFDSTDEAVVESGLSALGFRTLQIDDGLLVQRLTPQDEDACVGRIPMVSAKQESSPLLSLLALDPALAECDLGRALYFDTETTGLGGAGSLAFLIGLAWFDEKGTLILEQLLLEDPGQESAQLARVQQLFSSASLLISFNGKSFDWPLLQSRLLMNQKVPLSSRPHLDLLHVSRRLHKRRLDRFRLVDLEREVLGFERGSDDIPGAEIPPLYAHYLRSKDESVLVPVVEHNAWDILSMVALVGLYGGSLEELTGSDLLGLTETFTRAKSFDAAALAVGRAMEEGEGTEALALRARLHKVRGDKARALLDYALLSSEVDDEKVRLELVKLYEHHAKDFEKALAVMAAGTGEAEEDWARRHRRLRRRNSGRKAAEPPESSESSESS